jgi:hypothetical protein
MIHRVRINKNTLLNPEFPEMVFNNGGDETTIISHYLETGTTTTWINGLTLTSPWTNSNIYPTLSNPNNYNSPLTKTETSNTVKFDQEIYNKTITIPLELNFEPMDYSEDVDNWVGSETQKAINKILDGEKTRYISAILTGVTVEFRFTDKSVVNGPYTSSYNANGFVLPQEFKTNRFNKSYFRLYFYDSNTGETANLLFTEDFPVEQEANAKFVLKTLWWNREDELMENSYDNRRIYMEGRFFNAKTGQIQTFYNPPTTKLSPIGVSEYSNTNNRGWRTSPIVLINPNNASGEYRFQVVPTIGGNELEKITLSEFILT